MMLLYDIDCMDWIVLVKDITVWAGHSAFIVEKDILAFPVWCVANITIDSVLL